MDPVAATNALIDVLGAPALEKAAAYTAGGHWLLVLNVVATGITAIILIRWGILDRLEARLSRAGANAAAFCVTLACFLLVSVVSALVAAFFFTGVYALMRRAGRRWWLWSGGLAAMTASAMLLISPILIEPLFNDYKPLPQGEVRQALENMATKAGVPPDRLFVYDGSRQSNNFTANVAGVGGTARIAISDVAFRGASLDEVKAVTGHEIGHYVIGHVWYWVALVSVFSIVALFAADRLFPLLARATGSGARIADPRGLPVVFFIVALFSLAFTPISNAVSRHGERAADRYSLETVNLPDALASALVKTAEYRDPRPHWLQEAIFYTHPSVESRVLRAMKWKAGLRDE